jgi:hypothetical protein
MDFDKYTIKLNLKSCCLYEQLSGKSFFKLGNDVEDVILLMYASLITNNPSLLMSLNTFKVLIGDKKVSKWISDTYQTIAECNAQIKGIKTTFEGDEEKNEDIPEMDGKEMTINDVATSLIMQHKLDAHYVMYEMSLWEIKPLFQCAENCKHAEMVEKRFWTYLNIMPHVDHKKLKKPEHLVTFQWEAKEIRERSNNEIKNNLHAIRNMVGKKFDWIK